MDMKILVGIESLEAGRDAAALGVTLARAHDAPLVLAGVDVAVVGPGSHGYADAIRVAVESDLAALRAELPGDVAVSTRVIASTSPVRGLHELVEETDADVLVLGPTHLGRAARAVRGDVTLGVLHAAPCAVAVAPEGYAGHGAPRGEIGVAYAATEEGRGALETAIDLAEHLGARLRIVSVAVDPVAAFSEPTSFAVVGDEIREQAQQALDEACELVGDRVPAHGVLLEGDAAARLAVVSAELDLLVMGSRAYGPARRVLLGSVSSHVVHGAACPVLVLPRGVRVPAAR
jgi:nucleotide-binding universal stress UspA family protein